MEHKWKENAVGEGQFNGKMTFLQGYKCPKCKKVIFLPLGMNPKDYATDSCEEVRNA